METQRWTNKSHPQTLLFATYLLYFDAFFGALNILLGGRLSLLGLLLAAGSAAAGFGIANDRKWGYYLGVAVSGLALALLLLSGLGNVLGLMFAVAQLALLLHPMSRDYQKIWFR
ncbi:MAG: hypothetical protein M3Q68_01295 [Actinomycetota bacterium]|nr:hypothetical protein [Actinomycetota bacterium]